MNLFSKKTNRDNIVLNSANFIKSLDLSGTKINDFVGYNLYLEILKSFEELNESYKKASNYIDNLFRESFVLSKFKDSEKIKTILNNEKRIVGNIEFTVAALIKRWMELQDDALSPTFKETMNYSDSQIEQIKNSLLANELKFAEILLNEFYKNYLKGEITGLSLDKITKKTFYLNYSNNIPFKKYSNIQFVDNHSWRENVFKYPIDEDSDDKNEEELEIEDEITKRLDDSLGDSIWEIGNRNFTLYDFELKKKTLKYPILNISVFESLDKYVSDIEVFKNSYCAKMKFLMVFDNSDILYSIENYHGKEKRESMTKLIDAIYNYKLIS